MKTRGFTPAARQWVVDQVNAGRGWHPTSNDGEARSYFRQLLERAIALAVSEEADQVDRHHLEAADAL